MSTTECYLTAMPAPAPSSFGNDGPYADAPCLEMRFHEWDSLLKGPQSMDISIHVDKRFPLSNFDSALELLM